MEVKKLLIIPDRKEIETSVRLAKEYDCGFEYNDFWTPQMLRVKDDVRDLVRYYRRHHAPEYATVHGAFLDVSVASDDPDIRRVSDQRVEQSLYAARLMGAEGAVFHTNFIPNFRNEGYRRGWLEKNVRYWAGKLDRYPDVNIYIENMFDMEYELLRQLGEALSGHPNFGICLDYAHAYVFGKEASLEEWVKDLAPYVRHMHINDNDGKADLHLPVGEGQIDWGQFKELYGKYLQNATVLIEHTDHEKIERSLKALAAL